MQGYFFFFFQKKTGLYKRNKKRTIHDWSWLGLVATSFLSLAFGRPLEPKIKNKINVRFIEPKLLSKPAYKSPSPVQRALLLVAQVFCHFLNPHPVLKIAEFPEPQIQANKEWVGYGGTMKGTTLIHLRLALTPDRTASDAPRERW